jgi:ribosome assembly protein 1
LRREAIRLKKLEISSNEEQQENINKVHEEAIKESDEPEKVNDEKHEFLAFARVFSGKLKKGQTLFVLSPKHNIEDFIGKNVDINTMTITELQEISKHCTKFIVNDIYLMMGRELELIDEVPCGNNNKNNNIYNHK